MRSTSRPRRDSSTSIRRRVEVARGIQWKRLAAEQIHCSTQMGPSEIEKHCVPDDSGRTMTETAVRRCGFSARAYNRTLKVGMTRSITSILRVESILIPH